jgi:predicted ABC-type ATPase/predicted metal-dependent hydrolase
MMGAEALQVQGLTFEVRRGTRRRTLEMIVDRAGALRIHAPEGTASHELAHWATTKLLWVHRKLATKAEIAVRAKSPDFVSGEIFSYLGRSYRLKVVEDQPEALRFVGVRFLLRRDARSGGLELFRRWYRRAGTDWLRKRVEFLAPRTAVGPGHVKVRDMGFRWASCSPAGAVSFHWKVLQLPVRLVDYVIIHELTHLLHPRHDEEFWACVERAMPDWQARKAEMAECATRYLSLGGWDESLTEGQLEDHGGSLLEGGMAPQKRIVIIAGPNGAGKTTFAREFLPREADCPDFINVDLIAAGLSPFDPERVALRAGRLMLAEIARRVRTGESFSFETTLSGRNYARLIPRWRSMGYHVKLIFLSLPSSDLAMVRVAARVAQGGHAVAENVVRRRFDEGLRHFETVYKGLVNSWVLYDNSGPMPRLVALGDNPWVGRFRFRDPPKIRIFSRLALLCAGRHGGRSRSAWRPARQSM